MNAIVKIIFVFAVCLFVSSMLDAQSITWQRTYGDDNIDYGYSIVQTPDEGYIAVGRKRIQTANYIFAMRLNKFGDTIWTKHYPGYRSSSIIKTSDNNYIILGYFSDIIKINLDGEIIWQSNYGFISFNIKETNDGSLIICGLRDNALLEIPKLLKLNSIGVVIFMKEYLTDYYDGLFSDLTIANDNNYVMCGNYSDSSFISDKLMLLKTDTAGNQLWFVGNDSLKYNYPHSIINSYDNGFIIGGTNNRSLILEFNNVGLYLWKKTFDSLNYGECHSIIKSNDGGFVYTGTWDSTNNSDYYVRLYKFDNNGTGLWRKSFGFHNNDVGFKVIQTMDSGYAIIGIRDNFNGGDIYIIKTDKYGYANPVVGISNNSSKIPVNHKLFQNYPNPFNPTTKINYSIPESGIVTIKIYDILGKEIQTLVNEFKQAGSYDTEFYGKDLSSGVYFVRMESGDFRDIKRMVLIK